jgi:hypothetical protein
MKLTDTLGDWIPYLAPLRPLLQMKPTESVSMRRETVSLTDIEFVTDRVLKVFVLLQLVSNFRILRRSEKPIQLTMTIFAMNS